MSILSPYELSIEELQNVINSSPSNSPCARAHIEQLKTILSTKIQEQAAQSIGDK